MTLQQLRYLREVVRSGLNISNAARNLHTSQPGVSKQLRMLEQELGLELFVRSSRGLVAVNAAARPVVDLAWRIVEDAEDLKMLARRQREVKRNALVIATSHSLARYLLPATLKGFARKHRNVSIELKYGDPARTLEFVANGEADIALTAELPERDSQLAVIPCYRAPRRLVALPGNPILRQQPLTLEAIAKAPMVAYDMRFTGRRMIEKAFREKGLTPNIVLTALDADGVKACVEHGLGIAILSVAYLPKTDRALRAVDVSHFFEPSTIYVATRRGNAMDDLFGDFIEMFAPHLTRDKVIDALWGRSSLPAPTAFKPALRATAYGRKALSRRTADRWS